MLRGASARIRLPITIQVLTGIHDTLISSSNPEKLVIWTIASTAFFGVFRLGELLLTSAEAFDPVTCLAWGDVAINSRTEPTMVQIHLKKSKCDQFGKGADIVIGRTGSNHCPVRAILQYVTIRKDQPQSPFFLKSSRLPVTKSWFTRQIREVLSEMGLPQDQYAGHSFRIGAATTAALAGIPDSSIQTLGRWHSADYLQYIRSPKEQLATFAPLMPVSGTPPTTSSEITH